MTDDRLTSLYREFGRVIYVRCRSMLDDDRAAEDATQETFVRVHRHIARVPPDREALYWIYRIATNVCLNEMRARRRRPDTDGGLPAGLSAELKPEDRLVDTATARRMIARCPERIAAVAWLHHIDGFDQDEVAAIVGVSRRTVASRLATFIQRARKLLGGCHP